jgi:hypothetical protein
VTTSSNKISAPPKLRRRSIQLAITLAWVVDVSLLAGAYSWIFFAGRSIHTIESFLFHLRYLRGRPRWIGIFPGQQNSYDDATLLRISMIIAAVTLLFMLFSLVVGRSRFRTLRMWLLFTAIVGAWLGLLVGWPEIYWLGQQRRVRPAVRFANEVVEELKHSWPTDDGTSPSIGQFHAYPIGNPRTLLLLSQNEFPGTSLRIASVERSLGGPIRFELGGDELGAWLEWRPDNRRPASFVSGLNTMFVLERSASLAPHWFLVRYKRSANLPPPAPADSPRERARRSVVYHATLLCPT